MTVMTKPNKRDVKKSTIVAETVSVSFDETVSPEVELGEASYRELQAMAKDAGLKASGSKATLIERLGG